MTIDSFEPILEAARAGAEWAWARIYAEMAPAVLGYLRAQRAHEPEDLTGEVFLDLVRGLKSFEGDERGFRAWVFTIARNRQIDDVRKRKRRIVSIALEEDLAERAGHVGDAEAEAVASLGSEEILRSLDALSADQRTVLLLRIFGGFRVSEIAEIVGKSEGAVKALHFRATSGIRERMALEGVTG